jgi:hypothetical protein
VRRGVVTASAISPPNPNVNANTPTATTSVTSTMTTPSAPTATSTTNTAAATGTTTTAPPAVPKVKLSEKMRIFFKHLYTDYKDVLVDAIADAKAKPRKAVFYLSLLGGVGYCMVTNPTVRSYKQDVTKFDTELSLVSTAVRNPRATRYLQDIRKMEMRGIQRFQSIGIATLVWRDNEDKANGVYHSSCKYVKPRFSEILTERLVDVGFIGKWWALQKNMQDFDVNPQEWNEDFEGEGGGKGTVALSLASMLKPVVVA